MTRSFHKACLPFARIAANAVRLTAGTDEAPVFGAGADHDVGCRVYKTLLPSGDQSGTMAHVLPGTLEDAPSSGPQAHGFASSTAAWREILDGLPQHEALP